MLILSNSQVGKQLARKLDLPHQTINLFRFPDGELQIKLPIKKFGESIILFLSLTDDLSPNDFVTAALVILAHLKRVSSHGKITLVLPYLPYTRQDKEDGGEINACRDFIALLKKLADKLIVVDPHPETKNLTKWFAPKKLAALSTNSLFLNYLQKSGLEDYFITAPDHQAAERYRGVAERLNKPLIIFAKKRLSGEKVKQTLVSPLPLSIKTAVFIDDLISTGGTILEAKKILEARGIKNFAALVSHFVGNEEALKNLRQAGFVVAATNSLERPHLKGIKQLDLLPLLAESLS